MDTIIAISQISLSKPTKSLYLVLIACGIFFLSLFSLGGYYFTKNIFATASGVVFIAFILLIILLKLRARFASGFIRNDMVILKTLSDRKFVLEFRCIRKIKNYTILGQKLSCIHFNFDGGNFCIYLLGSDNVRNGGEIISDARKKYYQKKKASHKPGSVHSA